MASTLSLVELGQIFARFQLPPIDPGRPFYLHLASSLWGSVQQALDSQGLRADYFTDDQDLEKCVRTNEARTMQLNFSGTDSHSHFASHTLARLMAQWHDTPEQAEAAALFQEYFRTYHLCQNDHIESGYHLKDFLDLPDIDQGFCGDEDDKGTCLETQRVWTLIDYHNNKHTVWSAPNLEGLLKRAWAHHPAISKAMRLEATLDGMATTLPRPRM